MSSLGRDHFIEEQVQQPPSKIFWREKLKSARQQRVKFTQGWLDELAVVELTHEVGGHPRGAVGTVVSAHPEVDAYTVELTDGAGRTVDLVDTRAGDLRVTYVV